MLSLSIKCVQAVRTHWKAGGITTKLTHSATKTSSSVCTNSVLYPTYAQLFPSQNLPSRLCKMLGFSLFSSAPTITTIFEYIKNQTGLTRSIA